MPDFYAREDYVYDGENRIFTIPFDYVMSNYVNVYINDKKCTSYLLVNDNQIQIPEWTELNAGDVVSLRRSTYIKNPLVVFSDKSILNEESQNLAQSQMFHSIQELYDNTSQFKEDTTKIVSEGIETLAQNIDETKSELESQITQGDSLLQTEFNNFKNTVNLTAERLSLIDDCVVTSVNKAELAEEYAQAAKTSSDNAKLYSDNALESSTNATAKVAEVTAQCNNMIDEIGEEKNSAIQEITNAKNSAISDIVEAAAPSADALKNYYTKYEIDDKGFLTSHQDISGKVDKIEGKSLSSNDYTTDEKLKLESLQNYTLPIATAESLGGVKVDGETISIDENGVISFQGSNSAGFLLGEKITSYTPINDDRLHLADGLVLHYFNDNIGFCDHIGNLYSSTSGSVQLYAWKGYSFLGDDAYIYTTTTDITEDTLLYEEDGSIYLKKSDYYGFRVSNAKGNWAVLFMDELEDESKTSRSSANDKTASIPPKYFTNYSLWDKEVANNGYCNKFIYDKSNKSVRLPKAENNGLYSYICIK